MSERAPDEFNSLKQPIALETILWPRAKERSTSGAHQASTGNGEGGSNAHAKSRDIIVSGRHCAAHTTNCGTFQSHVAKPGGPRSLAMKAPDDQTVRSDSVRWIIIDAQSAMIFHDGGSMHQFGRVSRGKRRDANLSRFLASSLPRDPRRLMAATGQRERTNSSRCFVWWFTHLITKTYLVN
jgi:hypothetical protein